MLDIEYHVYIWQVSPQPSCGDTCQVWMWFKEPNRYFWKIENFAYGEINERNFSYLHPCLPLGKVPEASIASKSLVTSSAYFCCGLYLPPAVENGLDNIVDSHTSHDRLQRNLNVTFVFEKSPTWTESLTSFTHSGVIWLAGNLYNDKTLYLYVYRSSPWVVFYLHRLAKPALSLGQGWVIIAT